MVALLNMISLEEAADPNLPGEVKEECEKFGLVERVVVSAEPQGVVVVYVTFLHADSAGIALGRLNGRRFGGRIVTASLVAAA